MGRLRSVAVSLGRELYKAATPYFWFTLGLFVGSLFSIYVATLALSEHIAK